MSDEIIEEIKTENVNVAENVVAETTNVESEVAENVASMTTEAVDDGKVVEGVVAETTDVESRAAEENVSENVTPEAPEAEADSKAPESAATEQPHHVPVWLIAAIILVLCVVIDIIAIILPESGFGYEYEIVSGNQTVAVGSTVSVNLIRYKNINGEKVYQEVPEDINVEWLSLDEKILSVSQASAIVSENDSNENSSDNLISSSSVNVNVLAEGKGVITAQVGRKTASMEYTAIIPAEEIELSVHRAALDIEESLDISYRVLPKGAKLTVPPVYSSDNEEVAIVDADGHVTFLMPGYAHIIAEADGLRNSATVVVYAKLKSIELSNDNMELVGVDASEKLEVSYFPEFTTDKKETAFISDNPEVAMVDEEGNVTINGPGDAVITAMSGECQAQCKVHTSLPMTGIGVTQKNIVVPLGTTYRVGVAYFPEKTEDDKTTTYTSSDPAVATVNGQGVITASAVGNAVITVSCNGFTDTSNVRVNIPVSAVVISKTSLSLQTGNQESITAGVLPENTTEPVGISWSSNNTKVATVENGVVKGVSTGQAVITASCGGVSASCQVTVTAPPPPPAPVPVVHGGGRVVVLDPGHDSVHTGAAYYGVAEQDASMVVALACKSYLESNYGVTVYLTRSGAGPLAPTQEQCLEARCQFAQNVGASVMVSLHFNASPGHNASGAQVLVSSQANVGAASSSLGSCILNQLVGLGLRNNGLLRRLSATKRNPDGSAMDYYAIPRHCANRGIPAVIVEHCYIDTDTGFTTNPAMLSQLGVADAIGIAQYLGL